MMSLTRKRKLGSPERLQIGSKASKQEEWMSPPTSHNAPQSKPQVTPPCTPEKSQVCPTLLEPMAKGKDQGVVPETLSPRRQSPRSKGQSQTPHKDPKTTVSSEDPTQCHSPTEHPSPAEEDTELDLVITLDEQEGGGRRGRRKAAVKRKRGAGGEGVPPDCEFEVDGQLDRELESKSKQHNLTTVNVRNIIHEVITNEHVVAMMKAAISETQDMPMFEPKMTRSKLKEVVEKGVVIPTWNISPIKKAKEPPQFVDIPLDEEDSSDEEYCPDEDEEDETAEETFLESDVESTASSPRGSRLGRPRTPLDTSEGDEERSSSPTQGLSPPGPNQQRHLRVEVVPMGPPPPPKAPGGPSWPQQPDFSFMEKLHAVEEELEQSPVCMDSYQSLGDNLVACRTRSKRPLKDVPLGLLEAELRAPDITPDMYEMGGQEDNEWQGWLRGLMTSEVENDEEGDDEDDPEYNFLDDIDEPDLEDYRNDRAVRITKKEVNELMEELFETFQDELGVPDQDDEGHDDEEEREEEVEQGTPKFNVPQAIRFEEPLANMLTERRRTVKEQLEALQQRRALQESRPEPPAPAPAGPHFLMLPSPTCTLLLNPTQKHQLQQQMQQHVQLLTQVHMLTSTIPVLQSEAVTTRHFLTELQSFAQSTEETRGLVEPGFVSMFRACNLEGALSLLEEFDRTIKPQLTQASPQRPARQRCNTVVRPYPTMPPRLAWLLATRKEFLCPELLPICSLDPAQHPPRVKTIYTRGEDSLIALGLKHFADTEFPHQLVCRYLVRTKTAQQLRMHLREASHCRAPDNELKHFLLTRKVPPLLRACQRVLPTDSRPAVERELARMPAWLQKSLPIIHKAVLDYNSTLEGGEATPGESTPPYVFPPGTQYPPDLPADVTLRLNPYGVRTLKPHSRLWPHGRAKRLALSRPVVLPLDKTPMVLQMPLSTRPVNFNPTVTLTRISEKELEQNACKKASSSISKICPFLIPTLLPPVSSPCSAGGVMTGTAVAVQTPSTTVRLSVGPPCSAGGVKTGTVIAPQKPSTTVLWPAGAPCSAGGVKTGTVIAPQKPSTTVLLPAGAPCSAGGVKTSTVVAPQKPSTTEQLPAGAPCSAGGVKTGTVIAPQNPSTTVLWPAGALCSAGGVKTGTAVAPQKPSTTVQLSVGTPCSAGGVKTGTVIAPQKPSTTVQLSVGAPCSAGGVKTGTVIAPQKPSTTVLLPAGAPCSAGGVKTSTVVAPQKPSTTVQLSVGAPCSAGGVKTGTVIAPQKPPTTVQLSVGPPCSAGGVKTGTVIAPQKPSTTVQLSVGAPCSAGGVKTGTVIAPQKPSTTVLLPAGAPCSAGGVKTSTVVAPQKPSTTVQLSVGAPCSAGGVKTGTVIAPQKPPTTVQLSVGPPCSAGGVKTGTVIAPQKPSTTVQLSVGAPYSTGGVKTGTVIAPQKPPTTVQLSVGPPCSAGGVKTGTVIAPQKPPTTEQLSVGTPYSTGGVKTGTVIAPQKPSTTVQLSVGTPYSTGGVKTGTVIAPQKPSTTVLWPAGAPCSAGGVKTGTVIAPQKPSTTVQLSVGAPYSTGGVKTGTVIAPQKPPTTEQLPAGAPCPVGGVKTGTAVAPQKPSTTVQLSVGTPYSTGGVKTGTVIAPQKPPTTVLWPAGALCSAGGVKTGTVIAPQKPSTTVQLSVGTPCSAGGVKTGTAAALQNLSTTVQLPVGAPCSSGGVKTSTVVAPQKPSTTEQLSVGTPCSGGGVKTGTVIAPQKPSTTEQLPAGAPCSAGGVKTGTAVAPQKPSATVQLSVGAPCSAGGVKTGTVIAPQKPSTTEQLPAGAPCSAGGVKTGTVVAPQNPSTTVQLSVDAPCSAGGVITGTAVAAQTPLCTVQIPVSVPYKAKRAKKGAAVALQTSSTTLRFPVGASYGTGGVMTGMEGGAQTPSCTVQIPVSAPCQAGGAGTGMSVASATPGITVQLRAAPPVSFSRAMVAAGVNPSSQFLQIRPVSRSPSHLQAPLQPLLLTIPTGGSVSLYSLGGASVGGVGSGGAGGMLFPRAVGETGPRRVCRVLQPTVVIKLGTPLTTAVTAADRTSAETPPEPASQPQDPVTHPDGALAVLRKLVGVAPESGRSPTLKGDIPLQLRTSPLLQCSIPSPESRHPVSINPTSLPSPAAPETSPGNLGTNTSEVEGAPQLSSKPPDVMGQERAGAMQDPHSCQVAIHIPVSMSAGGPPECMDSQSLESSTLTHAEMAAPLKSAAPQCPEPQQPTAGTTEEMNPTGAVPHLSTNTANDTETSQKVWISTDTGAAQPLSQELQGCTVKSVPQNFSSIMDTKGTPQYSTVNAENKGVLPTPSSDTGTKEAPPGNSNTIFNKGTPTNSSELISTLGVRSETSDRGQGQTETPESQTFTSHNVGSCEGSGGVPQESSEAKDTTGSSCRVSGMHPSPFLCTPLGACLPEGEIEEVEEDREDLGQEEEHEEEMGSDFGEPLLALSESSGSPASSLDSQADALERLMEIEGEKEGRGNEEEREGGNLTCRDSVPQLQRGTEEEEEGGRGSEEEMERGGLTCRDIVPQVERGTEKEEEEKGGRGSEEERERGGSTSRDGVPQLERGNTEGGGSSPQLERNEEERETEKERGASVCRDSVLSLRRDTEGEEEGGRTVSGHGSPQLENNEEEDGGGPPGPRRSETEGEEGERTGQEEDRARVNTTACRVEWGLQGEAGGGGLALSSGTESQGQPGQAGEGGGGGGGGGGGEQEGQRGGGADQVGEGESGGEGERDGGEGEKRGEGEGGEDESEKGDGDGERQGEGEEEEDFDDLTQDEDEEEVMSSASEESVLSVPELQETMEKLTWLASERRMCPEGDSEEDNSQNSQNSQEENSEEEEEVGPRKGEEAGDGDASKMIGQGAPQGAGPLETSDKCAGRGRGRGRTPSRSLRRSRRRERDSKDTSKLLLLYDDNILENDPMRESKDIAFAQAYLNRVREALQGYPGKVEEFLGVLYEFERGREQRSAVELFSQLRAVLTDWPDLLRDFAAFLLPEQALECGLFAEQQAFERSRRFLRQLEICFGENSSQYQKIVKALQVGPELSPAGVEELKVQMASLLKGHSHLEGEFWVFFDELRPPPSRPGQFEEAAWPEEGEGCAEGGFEEVTLPDLEEEEESHKIPPITGRGKRRKEMGSHGNEKECDWPEAAKDCPCPCHDSAHDAKLRRHKRKGCPHCHVAKGSSDSSRPSRNREPSEPGASSPGRASAEGRLGGGEEEGEGNSPPAGPAGSGVRPWDCGEGGAPREEAEEGEAERDKDSGGGSPSPKKSRTDAGAAVATETEAWEEGGCRDPQGAPRAPLPCCSAPPHTQGEPLGGQSPSLSSTPLRMSSGSDSTVCAKNISLTPSGEKVILWNREADRVILTTCQQQGASQATFQAISAQLGNKTTSEVSRRFRDLMRLFHTAARQLSSEDEASAAEQQSATDEELD